ncbi:hypothetical protein JMJ56_18640 [Belnapia sp. T18]|uniref:General secretion pathway protein D n=1 Tax=Belnapia arida TaxID=2804533 RepID=A0ABS1U5W7_9PROT|nr:secretin N-terminal domain-containing protein [Belnapia arida]MBL6080043.1 hypothetical protein [Belnapia arida]
MRSVTRILAGLLALGSAGCIQSEGVVERGTLTSNGTTSFVADPGAGAALTPSPARARTGGFESIGTTPAASMVTRPAARVLPAVTGDRRVQLDYVNMPAAQVARDVLASILGLTAEVDQDVTGRITLQTDGAVPVPGIPALLDRALAAAGAGLAATPDGRVRVARLALLDGPNGPGRTGTQVIPLRYAQTADVLEVLQRNLPPGVSVAADPGGRGVLISGPADRSASMEELVRLFDVDTMQNRSFGLYPLTNAAPAAVLRELEVIFNGRRGGLQLTAVERLNAILVVTDQPALLARVRRTITQLDTGAGASASVTVYPLQYRRAGELADVLSRTFGGPGVATGPTNPAGNFGALAVGPSGPTGSSLGSRVPGGMSAMPASLPPDAAPGPNPTVAIGAPPTAAQVAAELGLSGPVRIQADSGRNSLIVLATPTDSAIVERAIRRLDIRPRQVFIEAVIAEVSLNETLRYGLDYSLRSGSSLLDVATPLAPLAGGFSYVLSARNIGLTLQALSAITQVKVVSAPRVLVLDNETATLQVGNQIPVLTQTSQSTQASGAPIVSSVDLRDTGVILAVRARVSPGGGVSLDLFQEVSDAVTTSSSTINSPTIQLRRLQSSIQVRNGDTIALGGLMRDRSTRDRTGIPVLSSLPLLGPLFGTRQEVEERTELLVLLTPRIVEDGAGMRDLVEALREKMGALAPDVADRVGPPILRPTLPSVAAPPMHTLQ